MQSNDQAITVMGHARAKGGHEADVRKKDCALLSNRPAKKMAALRMNCSRTFSTPEAFIRWRSGQARMHSTST